MACDSVCDNFLFTVIFPGRSLLFLKTHQQNSRLHHQPPPLLLLELFFELPFKLLVNKNVISLYNLTKIICCASAGPTAPSSSGLSTTEQPVSLRSHCSRQCLNNVVQEKQVN